MRQLYWLALIIIGSVTSVIVSVKIQNASLLIVGIAGGLFISFLYGVFSNQYEYNKDQKRLEKENKYRKYGKCTNCDTTYSFEVEKGVCMMEFLKDKKCKTCSCELQIPNEVDNK